VPVEEVSHFWVGKANGILGFLKEICIFAALQLCSFASLHLCIFAVRLCVCPSINTGAPLRMPVD